MRRSDQRGFSLAEVLLAIALLGILGSSATTLLTTLVGSSSNAEDAMTAHLLASQLMENSLQLGYDGLPVGTVSQDPISGFARFSSSIEVTQEATSLRRIRVVVTSDLSEETLETLVAERL